MMRYDWVFKTAPHDHAVRSYYDPIKDVVQYEMDSIISSARRAFEEKIDEFIIGECARLGYDSVENLTKDFALKVELVQDGYTVSLVPRAAEEAEI